MSGVVRTGANSTQYHVYVTTRSGQNKPRLIEVNTSTNTFTLSNFSNGKATIAREFDLRNLTKFERLANEVFLRLYFVSPAVSCDLSFPDLDALDDFIVTVKEYNPQVIDDVLADEAEEQPQQQQQPPVSPTNASQVSTSKTQEKDITSDIHTTQQQATQQQQATPVDQKKLVAKWRELLDKYGTGKNDGYKAYVRQGIPSSIRAEAWMSLSDLQSLKQQAGLGYYRNLITLAHGEQYAEVNRAIDQGLNLTDPKNAQNEHLHRACRILRAYNVRNVNVGYSQQLVFICALVISVLEEEDSFWLVVYFVEHICCVDISSNANNSTMATSKKGNNNSKSTANLEKDNDDVAQNHLFYYHHTNQLGLQIDQAVFGSLLQDKLPKIAAKLQQLSIPIPPLTSRWFTAILIHTLRADIVLRIWDCVLFDGVKALFRAYLTIFKWNEKTILKCTSRDQFIAALQEFASSPVDTNQFISMMHALWLRSFSIADVVHYRRLHAKVLISQQQMDESDQQRLTAQQQKQTQVLVTTPQPQQQPQPPIQPPTPTNQDTIQQDKKDIQPVAEQPKVEPKPIVEQPKPIEPKVEQKPIEQPVEPIKTTIPSLTQSAPVSRVILSNKHNQLFMTAASQQRKPAIHIYGARRAFSPPLPDCYQDGEQMSDYTDDEDEMVIIEDQYYQEDIPQQQQQDEPAPPPPVEDEPAPPPPVEDEPAPPPPVEDEDSRSSLSISITLPPPVVEDSDIDLPAPVAEEPIVDSLPPPVIKEEDDDELPPTKTDSKPDLLPSKSIETGFRPAAGFRRPTQTNMSPPQQMKTIQPVELVVVEDDELPPTPEELAARKQAQDEKLKEKAKQIALESMQKQNIKEVMASIVVPTNTNDTNDDDLLPPPPDSSDDEEEQQRQIDEQAEKQRQIDEQAQIDALPPNLAADTDDDDDDDGLVNPFGQKEKMNSNKDDNNNNNTVEQQPQEPDTVVPEPIIEQPKPQPAAFRRPLFKTKNDILRQRSKSNKSHSPVQPPQQQEVSQEVSQEQSHEPSQEQSHEQQDPFTEPEPPKENKAKLLIQRSLMNKKNATMRNVPKTALPPPPQESLPPPPTMDLPTPPPLNDDDDTNDTQQPQQKQEQQTQEAVFWPTEPVLQTQPNTNNNNNNAFDPFAAITNAVGPMVDPARRCAKCSQQIQHNALYANNQLFHQHCFGCTTCHTPLAGIPYYSHNNLPYCSQHYAIAKGYVCVYCKGAVTEGLTLGMNDYAHYDCVHCAQCHMRPSQQELARLANGETCIANQSTFHLHKQSQYQQVNKAFYYQFLCHQHYLLAKTPTPMASNQSPFQPPSSPIANNTSISNAPTVPSPSSSQSNLPSCYRCDLPLDNEITKVQGQQYHKACLTCPLCQIYITQALKKDQGLLFSEKKKGTFYCCDHTNDPKQCCRGCQEPLLLEPYCDAHLNRYHTYCSPTVNIPSSPTAATQTLSPPPPSTPLPQVPPPSSIPSTPSQSTTPQPTPCAICSIADASLPSVVIRGKQIHKHCLECVTCHTIMETKIIKTFPAMMYPTIYKNFQVRQPDYALQDDYYSAHTMAETHQHTELPVTLICSYCYDAYVKQ